MENNYHEAQKELDTKLYIVKVFFYEIPNVLRLLGWSPYQESF